VANGSSFISGSQIAQIVILYKVILFHFDILVCPDEIEKMMDVIDILHREQKGIPIVPIFISVDPVRDTVERVKKYCSEFSPKLRGFTGTKEQV
jgi:cytochrome oxidase Cu insertion factor (SCO1/SenC/PrrC family)